MKQGYKTMNKVRRDRYRYEKEEPVIRELRAKMREMIRGVYETADQGVIQPDFQMPVLNGIRIC
jgi:hypothetical protein